MSEKVSIMEAFVSNRLTGPGYAKNPFHLKAGQAPDALSGSLIVLNFRLLNLPFGRQGRMQFGGFKEDE